MTRRFREDSERVIRLRGYWVRRPMAVKVGPESATWQDVAEIMGGLVVFLTLFLGLPLLLFLIGAPR